MEISAKLFQLTETLLTLKLGLKINNYCTRKIIVRHLGTHARSRAFNNNFAEM